MSDINLTGVVNSDAYKSLASKRKRISYTLTGVNVLAYSIYVLCMGFARDFMSIPVGAGPMNIGIVMVIFLIIFAAVISGYYVWWTNKRYDPALKDLLSNLREGKE